MIFANRNKVVCQLRLGDLLGLKHQFTPITLRAVLRVSTAPI